MKQVVANKPESLVVYFENVSVNKFYGVVLPNKQKAIIQADNYVSTKEERTNFKLVSSNKFTIGNNYTMHRSDNINLTDYIKFLLSKGIVVYEFDKLSKLAEWLES